MRSLVAWLRATRRRVWWTSFGLFFALSLVWTFTTPPLGAGDELSHVVRAHALADGDWTGSSKAGEPTFARFVHVPAIYGTVGVANLCFVFDQHAPASCSSFEGTLEDVELRTDAGRHPPAYYAAVGFPTKFVDPLTRVDLMRVINAAICAALIASAVASTRRLQGRALVATGIVLAITPTTLYMFGIVNPNAPEVAAAIALWVAGTLLVRAAPEERVDHRLVARVGVAASILVLTRQTSPFWLLLIGLTLLALSSRATLRKILTDRTAQVWGGVVTAAVVAQLAWIAIVKPLDVSYPAFAVRGDLVDAIKAAIGEIYPNYVEMVGALGFMNEPVPQGVLILWTCGIAVLVALAWMFARRQVRWVLAGLVAAVLVVPTALEAAKARDAGLFWQGRYTLPLAVGIPIVAALGLARRDGADRPGGVRLERLVPLLAGVFVIGQVVSYAQQLRRWTVGSRGSLVFFLEWHWSPSLPPWLLLATFVGLIGLIAWWLFTGDDECPSVPDGVGPHSTDHAAVETTHDTPVEASDPALVVS
jgi:hypothetical protein